jgi:hypothetical protein
LLRHQNLSMTGRYVNRADDPLRTLSDQVGERISAAMAGWPAAEVVPLEAGKDINIGRPSSSSVFNADQPVRLSAQASRAEQYVGLPFEA